MCIRDRLKERREYRSGAGKDTARDLPFLKELSGATVRGRKSLVFFIGFSAFCFSAMVQMSMSMKKLASETFAYMIITIGLLLACVTLLLSLSSVVKGNTKTIAMMRVFGYQDRECSKAVLGGYRPVACVGFVIGTIYQYALLKVMVTVVFSDVGTMPEYCFDFKVCGITLVLFIFAYELAMYAYSRRIRNLPLKSVMLE